MRAKKKDMSFLEHLETLRRHIIKAFLGVFIFAVVAFAFRGFIFDSVLFAPKMPDFFTNYQLCRLSELVGVDALCINQNSFEIINIKMAGQFMTHITISLLAGLVMAFPYVFWQFWLFVRPALKLKERKQSRGAVFFTSILFSLGALFGYYIISPLSLHFLGGYEVSTQVNNQINLNSYIQTVTSVVLASAVIFELPILIYFLSKIGLISSTFLKKYRKHSIVIVLVLSAIITPPDVFSQILVAVPLFILYEAGILIAKRIERKRAKLEQTE